jgi:hypothetical protein
VPSLLAEDIAEAGLGLVLGTSFEPLICEAVMGA